MCGEMQVAVVEFWRLSEDILHLGEEPIEFAMNWALDSATFEYAIKSPTIQSKFADILEPIGGTNSSVRWFTADRKFDHTFPSGWI